MLVQYFLIFIAVTPTEILLYMQEICYEDIHCNMFIILKLSNNRLSIHKEKYLIRFNLQ